mgnify:CR=1 FL=1|jgi:hypothetical protein
MLRAAAEKGESLTPPCAFRASTLAGICSVLTRCSHGAGHRQPPWRHRVPACTYAPRDGRARERSLPAIRWHERFAPRFLNTHTLSRFPATRLPAAHPVLQMLRTNPQCCAAHRRQVSGSTRRHMAVHSAGTSLAPGPRSPIPPREEDLTAQQHAPLNVSVSLPRGLGSGGL